MHSCFREAALAVCLVVAAAAVSPTAGAAGNAGAGSVPVIVRAQPGSLAAATRAVRSLGGVVEQRIGLIGGFVAALPVTAIPALQSSPAVASVSADSRLTLSQAAADGVDGTDVVDDLGSLYSIRSAIGADAYWNAGFTGAGVDVALIDSGVAPVEGLTNPGAVINGPDLSFESQSPSLRYMDTFGHGTHMAGIIAGRDPGAAAQVNDRGHFLGIAPAARILSLKVADAFGTTDLSQVLVAMDWVVKHRADRGMNIRVLNLSFGTDSTQAYTVDPLAFAVEMAWRKGIFVVVSAGNNGYGSPKLNDPADDPFVMAVGASDNNGTQTTADDVVASFSSVGDSSRHPDLVAPGRSVVSLRDPGSFIDTQYPGGRWGLTPRLFRGSGTSQATAVVSGAAALIIQQRPTITPDQLKKLLTSTAAHLPQADSLAQGAGLIDLAAALRTATPAYKQRWRPATGKGSLEMARGSLHLYDQAVSLVGEKDIFGKAFDSASWSAKSSAGNSFQNGLWMGEGWTGLGWTGRSWTGASWAGRSWTGGDWAGRSWTSAAWTGRSWTSAGWTGGAWTGRSWTSSTWSGNTWSSADWGGP